MIHVVLDNLRMHKGKQVQAWLAEHPRFVFHHPPVHCSWMNQVEQWFSILQRKRLAIADFADKAELAERLHTFLAEWNEHAHPFNWTSAQSQVNLGVGRFSEMVILRGTRRFVMQKKYIVRLTDEERVELKVVVKKLKE